MCDTFHESERLEFLTRREARADVATDFPRRPTIAGRSRQASTSSTTLRSRRSPVA